MEETKKFLSLSLVFPAYNEEKNLPILLKEISNFISLSNIKDFEVIVVNDGSKDGTKFLLDRYKQTISWLKVVHHPKNLGYGAAVKRGILEAKKEIIFFSDADLQFDLRFLLSFIPFLQSYHAILGYRAPRADPLHRRLFGLMWTKLVSLLFGFKVRDVDCAFKLFRYGIKDIVKNIESKGATFSTELLVLMRDAGWKWIELPVLHLPRREGQQTGANIRVILNAFKELFFYWRIYCQQKKTVSDRSNSRLSLSG